MGFTTETQRTQRATEDWVGARLNTMVDQNRMF
jgi:hypothetical protein